MKRKKDVFLKVFVTKEDRDWEEKYKDMFREVKRKVRRV